MKTAVCGQNFDWLTASTNRPNGATDSVRNEPGVTLLLVLISSEWLLRGALAVLIIVTALGLLHIGQSGVGFLNAAFPQTFPDVGGFFKGVYTYAWFVGLAIAAVAYGLGMSRKTKAIRTEPRT